MKPGFSHLSPVISGVTVWWRGRGKGRGRTANQSTRDCRAQVRLKGWELWKEKAVRIADDQRNTGFQFHSSVYKLTL